MSLIKHGILSDDPFIGAILDQFDQPAPAPVVCSLQGWQQHRTYLLEEKRLRAIKLQPGDTVDALEKDLPNLDVVMLSFPKFTDGRGFSQARQLRQDFGFSGEIRATGSVLPDQALFLSRSGIDTVEIPDSENAPQWQFQADRFQSFYQPGAEDITTAKRTSPGTGKYSDSTNSTVVAAAWAY